MTHRRGVRPHVFKVHTVRIHGVTVAAVVVDLAAAMPASLDRRSDLAERLWFALREIKQAVMAGVEPARYRKAAFHVDRDVVAEAHALLHEVGAEHDVPPGNVVDEQRAAGPQHTHALIQPRIAPGEIVVLGATVIAVVAVLLVQIKRWIRKNSVDGVACNDRKKFKAVTIEKSAQVGTIVRLQIFEFVVQIVRDIKARLMKHEFLSPFLV